jgi:hypothetical protein
VAWTTDDFVEKVRLGAMLPDASDITAADILSLGDDELGTVLTTGLKTAREGYWDKLEDIALSTSVRRYRLPRRASLRGARSVSLVDAAGKESPFDGVESTEPAYGTNGGSRRFYLEDDFLVFMGDPEAGYSLRVRYQRRPSKLVPVASCSAITSCPSSATLLMTSATQLFATKLLVDVVRGDAPFDLMYTDLKVNGFALSVYTFGTTLSGTLDTAVFADLTAITNERQDYLCPRDTTCYPPLPLELQPVLVSAVVRRVMEITGDRAGAGIANATMNERLKGMTSAIQPRVQNETRLLTNRSTSLRGGFGGGRRRR